MIIYTSCWSTMLYWFHEKLTCLTYGCFCTLPYFWQMKKNMWKRIFFLNGWVLVKNFFSFLNDLSPLLFSAKSLSQYITHEANLITRLLLKDFRGPVLVLFFNITRSSYMSCLILHTPCALFISLNMCKTVSVICRSWSKVPIIYCIVTLKTIFDNYKNIFCLQKHFFIFWFQLKDT